MLTSLKNKLIILLVILIMAFGLYLYFRPTTPTNQTLINQSDRADTLFPVGTTTSPTSATTTVDNGGILGAIGQTISNLFNASSSAVNNSNLVISKRLPMSISGFFLTKEGGIPFMYFMEKATGHVAKINLQNDSMEIVSNTTLPGVEETYWGVDGTNLRLIARYLKNEWDIESLSGSIPLNLPPVKQTSTTTASSSNDRPLKSLVLDSRTYAFAVSPGGERIFSLNYSPTEGSTGLISDFGFKNPQKVFTNPLTEWLPTWITPNIITLQIKSSGMAEGFLFSLNLTTGSFNKILGNIKGFTALPGTNLGKVAYSGSGDAFKLKVIETATGKISNYNLQTLPEKCVWATDAVKLYCAVPVSLPANTLLPDSWYSGEVVFTDNIWLINTKTGETSRLYKQGDSSDVGSFDAIDLRLDSQGKILYFRNKNDSTLWSLKFGENSFIP